jgi:hypothetical protein
MSNADLGTYGSLEHCQNVIDVLVKDDNRNLNGIVEKINTNKDISDFTQPLNELINSARRLDIQYTNFEYQQPYH